MISVKIPLNILFISLSLQGPIKTDEEKSQTYFFYYNQYVKSFNIISTLSVNQSINKLLFVCFKKR